MLGKVSHSLQLTPCRPFAPLLLCKSIFSQLGRSMDLYFISNQVVTSPRASYLTSLGIVLGSLAHLIKASKSIAFASVRPPLQPPPACQIGKSSWSLVFGLLAVYQNSAIYIRVCGSQDGYCSSTLPANLASVFSTCLFVLLFGLGGCFASHASVAVKSAERLPLSLLTALPYTPNANMADLSAGPGLVARKRG